MNSGISSPSSCERCSLSQPEPLLPPSQLRSLHYFEAFPCPSTWEMVHVLVATGVLSVALSVAAMYDTWLCMTHGYAVLCSEEIRGNHRSSIINHRPNPLDHSASDGWPLTINQRNNWSLSINQQGTRAVYGCCKRYGELTEQNVARDVEFLPS